MSARHQCWHSDPHRADTRDVLCRDLPPPGPPNPIHRGPYVDDVTYWCVIVFCVVMVALLLGTAIGWWGR